MAIHQEISEQVDIKHLHPFCFSNWVSSFSLSTPIIHIDLKPSSILPTEYMVAHVGDFGVTKVVYTIFSNSLHDQSS